MHSYSIEMTEAWGGQVAAMLESSHQPPLPASLFWVLLSLLWWESFILFVCLCICFFHSFAHFCSSAWVFVVVFLSQFSICFHGALCVGSSRVDRKWLKTRKPSESLCWVLQCSLVASPRDLELGMAQLWSFCGPGPFGMWSRPGLQLVSFLYPTTTALYWRGVKWHH